MATPFKALGAPNDELFAGTSGTVVDDGASSASRITFDALLSAGFEPEVDMERLSNDLCRAARPAATSLARGLSAARVGAGGSGARGTGSRVWPVVCPSVELYGAVAGWKIPERGLASEVGVDTVGGSAESATTTTTNQGQISTPSKTGSSSSSTTSKTRTTLVPILDRNLYEPYRWMFSPLHERAAALQDHVDEIGAAILMNSQIPASLMSIGRICSDAETNDKLGESSAALELDRAHGSARVNLDLRETNLKDFRVLFPGQVIGVQGSAPTGDKLMVTRILTDGSAPRPRVPAHNAAALHKLRSSGGPVRVWSAVGPYTYNTDLKFSPLEALLASFIETKPLPDVLILQGPFVDAEHPEVKTGSIEFEFESETGQKEKAHVTAREVFCDAFRQLLYDYLSSAQGAGNTQIILMPTPSDVICEPIFPQWPLPRSLFEPSNDVDDDEYENIMDVNRRILVLPNPATFIVGDVVFGATSVNTLGHMNMDAQRRTNVGGDDASKRYDTLVRHILEQRSYYPLFPSGITPGETTPLPLEVTKLWHCGTNVKPDVLLLPTFKYGKPACVKEVDGTVVVNPGPMTKPAVGGKAVLGTIAKIAIFPGESPFLDKFLVDAQGGMMMMSGNGGGGASSGDQYSCVPAASRIRVEIVKMT